jgi:light-regulated signal transduction histidine kinase (bacteriophytochrome)
MNTSPAILVAHRNTKTRQAISRILAKHGFRVLEAKTPDEILETAAQARPAAVLLEDKLDARTNETSRTLKEIGGGAVLIYGSGGEYLKRRSGASESNADGWVPAPWSEAGLLSAVEMALKLGDSRDRIASASRNAAEFREREKRGRQEFHQFARRICHDFQEPLRAMSTFVQLIQTKDGLMDRLSQEEKVYLTHVIDSANRVRRLLDYFLAYSQAASDTVPAKSAVPLSTIAERVVLALKSRIEEAGAEVMIAENLPLVWGNLVEIQQVLHILLGNALKYRSPARKPVIGVSAEPLNGEKYLISVSDNGMGVHKQYHEAIFAPFRRLHGREIPGFGMGLALCRKIVENHGGKIWVESAPGEGSKFLFTLPRVQESTRAAS